MDESDTRKKSRKDGRPEFSTEAPKKSSKSAITDYFDVKEPDDILREKMSERLAKLLKLKAV